MDVRTGFHVHDDVVGARGRECTSSGFFVRRRSAFTTSGPMVILGTKCPSITSTWIQSAPAASTDCTSSPSLAKSADRIDGAMRSGRRIKFSEIAVRVTRGRQAGNEPRPADVVILRLSLHIASGKH